VYLECNAGGEAESRLVVSGKNEDEMTKGVGRVSILSCISFILSGLGADFGALKCVFGAVLCAFVMFRCAHRAA